MDEDTRKTLAFMGWCEQPGRDAGGNPYIDFIRGGHFFRVMLDSRREIRQKRVPYGYGMTGRRANSVVVTERP